jgi:hypothetical protein
MLLLTSYKLSYLKELKFKTFRAKTLGFALSRHKPVTDEQVFYTFSLWQVLFARRLYGKPTYEA